MKRGTIIDCGGASWILGADAQGKVFRTNPVWTGLFRHWQAKRYARKNEIDLRGCTVINHG